MALVAVFTSSRKFSVPCIMNQNQNKSSSLSKSIAEAVCVGCVLSVKSVSDRHLADNLTLDSDTC